MPRVSLFGERGGKKVRRRTKLDHDVVLESLQSQYLTSGKQLRSPTHRVKGVMHVQLDFVQALVIRSRRKAVDELVADCPPLVESLDSL